MPEWLIFLILVTIMVLVFASGRIVERKNAVYCRACGRRIPGKEAVFVHSEQQGVTCTDCEVKHCHPTTRTRTLTPEDLEALTTKVVENINERQRRQ